MFANIHLLSLKEQKTGIQPLLDTRHSFNQLLMKLNYSASPVEDQLSLLQPLSCDQALSVCSPALMVKSIVLSPLPVRIASSVWSVIISIEGLIYFFIVVSFCCGYMLKEC